MTTPNALPPGLRRALCAAIARDGLHRVAKRLLCTMAMTAHLASGDRFDERWPGTLEYATRRIRELYGDDAPPPTPPTTTETAP